MSNRRSGNDRRKVDRWWWKNILVGRRVTDTFPNIDPEILDRRNRHVWQVDDLVQISPTYDPAFGGAIMIVDEVKSWGVQGYVVMPHRPSAQTAWYRLPFESDKEGCTVTGMKVGMAHWLFSHEHLEGDPNEQKNEEVAEDPGQTGTAP